MKNHYLQLLLTFLLVLSVVFTAPVQAQPSDPDAANCEEVKDPDIRFQLDLCTAHVGCGLVLGIHKACVKTKKFLTNLKNVMTRDAVEVKEAQAADTSLFGKLKSFVGDLVQKEVSANQVFEATLSDQARSLQGTDKDWKNSAAPIQAGIAKADKQQLTGRSSNNTNATYTYVGDVKDGEPHGWGTQYWSTGQINRGQFKDGRFSGAGEIAQATGTRALGTFENNQLQGAGLSLQSDGRFFKGQFANDQAQGSGAFYRADGSLLAKGLYENNSLSVGEVYDAQGNVIQSIDKPRDTKHARELADQEFRSALTTMTAQELFARANELFRADKGKADQFRQALMERFPGHPLSARMTEQIAAERVAAVEAARRRDEMQRQQEILARQQAEQARQQAERDRATTQQAAREKEARDLKFLQDATILMNTLSGITQQRKQGSAGGSGAAGPCPNGGNLVNGVCRIGVAQ